MLLISFHKRDGYFRAPLSDKTLCARIKKARDQREEISFSFERDLKILSVY
jgi:hypothetical protein